MAGKRKPARSRRVEFVVSFDLPPCAMRSGALDYVRSAVVSECGQLHPDDPMHDLDRSTVKVRSRLTVRKTTSR